MNNSKILSSPADIDLSKHGIIEAHAGTGKTYTIVKMVLRMLEQPSKDGKKFIHLRDILLVTYTEKAAGELKKRIQDGIAPRIKELRAGAGDEDLALHLESCLNNMHEALIGTIHSVCLRLLRTWPFETGVQFNTQIVNDEEGMETLLRVSMRTDWYDESTHLPQLLQRLTGLGVKLESKHLKLIRSTALEFLEGNRQIDVSAEGGMSIEELLDRQEDADNKAKMVKKKKLSLLESQLLYALIRRAAERLSKRYEIYKRENGLVSYGDMLRLMHSAVHKSGSDMLDGLRKRLQYGIIDEFQDTSVIQWEIFKKIFLDDGAGAKFYIVGDPKQSIYSFQNADIQSYIAAKGAIARHGGAAYSLVDNYRSLPEMIDGYNAILGRRGDGDDWFCFDGDGGISYPSSGQSGELARPPKRGESDYPLEYKAVQVVALNGKNVAEDRQKMAEAARAAIQKLKGTTVSLPHGTGWENLTLDYKDFAVIVETHDYAGFFIDEFRKHGIPCMKYKLTGVFSSAMARDLRAVLTAINKRFSKAPRVAALLTCFFNRPAEAISPADDLVPCPNRRCEGDNLCIAHALDIWGKFADRQLWAQLFRSITEKTGVWQRLIRLVDGERMLADLRQVVDYCVEYLYQQNSNLELLADHLERLYNNEESAGQDKNIHTLSTERSSVRILTMHASKGLEFPVVFLMNRAKTRRPNGPNVLHWSDEAKNERRFTPYLSTSDVDENALSFYDRDYKRERRRLLYVAMTRPQAMLFVPMQKDEMELTPRLERLLESESAAHSIEKNRFGAAGGWSTGITINGTQPIQLDDIPRLSLQNLICREMSYSRISKGLSRIKQATEEEGDSVLNLGDGCNDVVREDEYHTEDLFRVADIDTDIDTDINTDTNADINTAPTEPQILPGGSQTGDALHKAIEELLDAGDINTLLNDNAALDKIIEKHLNRGGILDDSRIKDPKAAVRQASFCIKTALTTPYPLPNAPDSGGTATIAGLGRADRLTEVEFTMPCGPHRIRGFIDLVFRVKNDNHPAHPWRYYFADWKSDTLKSYDENTLKQHCRDQNYTLQAQIYALALDKYLAGILGEAYSRDENLGGSLYVFLRGDGACFSENIKNYTFKDADIYILIDKCFTFSGK